MKKLLLIPLILATAACGDDMKDVPQCWDNNVKTTLLKILTERIDRVNREKYGHRDTMEERGEKLVGSDYAELGVNANGKARYCTCKVSHSKNGKITENSDVTHDYTIYITNTEKGPETRITVNWK